MSASGGHSATLAYDPLGRLWQVSSTSTGTTRFFYDGDDLAIESDGSGNVLRAYFHGDGADSPMIWYEATSGGTSRRFLHRDERGSITAVADQSGNELAVNAYDEYGIPNSANQGRFGYTGQAWIGELGMWYYKARFYSPTLGRFLQTDPIGYADGMNFYAYGANDPVNNTDPTGLTSPGCPQTPGTITVCGRRPKSSGSNVPAPVRGLIGGFDFSSGYGALNGMLRNLLRRRGAPTTHQVSCGNPHGRRLVISPLGIGATGFLFFGGFSLSAETGISIPFSALHGNFRGTQVYASASAAQLVGLGAYVGAGNSYGVGVNRGRLRTGATGYNRVNPPSMVVQAGAAVAAGGEGQIGGTRNSISASGGGGPRVGYGAYAAGGVKHTATLASPQLCY